METTAKLQRPTFDHELVTKLAITVADILQKAKLKYFDHEQCMEDSKEILDYHWSDDGYKIAKELDEKGYEMNSSLVEELDCVSNEGDKLLKEKVREWVKQNDIKLDLSVGTKVKLDVWTKNNTDGEIVNLRPETAQYIVWTPECLTPKENGGGWVINFEKIKSVIQPETTQA